MREFFSHAAPDLIILLMLVFWGVVVWLAWKGVRWMWRAIFRKKKKLTRDLAFALLPTSGDLI